MLAQATEPVAKFPAPIPDAVRQAVECTFASILGEPPTLRGEGGASGASSGVLGTISFMGEPPWSVSLMLPEATAPALVEKFAGFAIPFDSPDMGDVVGELANVIAGDIVARCEAKRVQVQMSLPMVARGHDIEMLAPHGLPSLRLDYATAFGPFWFKIACAKPGTVLGRKPGT